MWEWTYTDTIIKSNDKMEIELIEVAGIAAFFNALRLPYSKTMRSEAKASIVHADNEVRTALSISIDTSDLTLAETLIKRGDEHAKAVRGLMAYFKIKAPAYWWIEMDTYEVGTTKMGSTSTMHTECNRLTGKELQEAKGKIEMSHEYTRVIALSYQTLRRIVHQRSNHRLPEWETFIASLKALPFNEFIFNNQQNKES